MCAQGDCTGGLSPCVHMSVNLKTMLQSGRAMPSACITNSAWHWVAW